MSPAQRCRAGKWLKRVLGNGLTSNSIEEEEVQESAYVFRTYDFGEEEDESVVLLEESRDPMGGAGDEWTTGLISWQVVVDADDVDVVLVVIVVVVVVVDVVDDVVLVVVIVAAAASVDDED